MPCLVTCSLAVAFLISMIYMYNATNRSQVLVQYEKQLPTNLQQLYKKIRDERQHISYYGYGLGFILSFIAIVYNSVSLKKGSSSVTRFDTKGMVCLAVVITFVTHYFYYLLTPKTTYMLEHINSPEQTKAWLIMYKTMQKFYHTGMLLGLVAVGLMALAFRC
jgi:uncharacterized membrane protein